MTNTDADKDLIARIAARDGTAMRTLFARHNVRVFRYLVRQVRNEAVAEELTNEVFLDVWRQAGKFEGRSAVSTWMLSIGRNKAISAMRKRSEETMEDDSATDLLADEDDTPEQHAQKRSKAFVIRTIIDALSAEHKEVIDLVYYHEKSIREVAEITGAPQATVKTRVHYARKQLGLKLKEAGIDRGWP